MVFVCFGSAKDLLKAVVGGFEITNGFFKISKSSV